MRAVSGVLSFLSACLLAEIAAAQEKKPELEPYEVVAGDSCSKIAKKKFNDSSRYDIIHKYNTELGPLPHKLTPGQVLLLPKSSTQPDAFLTQKRGPVRALPSQKGADWRDAVKGMDLYRAWRVNSQEKATAEVTFQDKSVISLRENTVVVIYGSASSTSKKEGGERLEAEIEKGTMKTSRAALLGGAPKLAISTPSAEADLGAGTATISVDDAGTTRVMNKDGESSKVYRKGSRKRSKGVEVAAGMGSKVEPKKEPTPPKPLPPAPEWVAGLPLAFPVLDGQNGTLRGSWAPVAAASFYEIEIAEDAGFSALQQILLVPATVTSFELQNLPPGTYHVRVTTSDTDKFESKPSSALALSLLSLALPGATVNGGAASVAPGATFQAPAGFRCAQAGGALAESVILAKSGELRCEGPGGAQMEPFPVTVRPVSFQVFAPGQTEPPALPRGETRVLSFRASEDMDAALAVQAPAGLEVSAPQKVGPALWELRVTAREDAPASAPLRLVLADADSVTLGEVSVEVAAPPAPPATQPDAPLPTFANAETLGLVAAGGLLKGEALGMAGFRVTKHAAPRVSYGLEAMGGITAPNADGDSLALFSLGGFAQYNLTTGKARPFALAGLGAAQLFEGDSDDARLSASAGLGLALDLNEATSLRADLRYQALLRPGEILSVPTGQLSIAHSF